MKDALGLALTGTTPDSLAAYQSALDEFRCFRGDPAALAAQAIAASPGMPMAHLLQAWLHLLGTEPAGLEVARAACDAAAALPANERERLHLQAARLLAAGHWYEAGRVLEDLSLLYPLDLLALQAGHQLDYFTGDARMLRDRIARALPAWKRGMPGQHAVLGMHAFGLEECADYAQAEKHGRLAVELEPRDGWAWHAVAHALEMRNEPAAGVAWLAPSSASWAPGSFLAVHNWWHLALFQLELGREEEVLRLYDEAIGTGSAMMLDLVDASAMLWRLQLRGVDLGARWERVADLWAANGRPGLYAFNDLHMMMAFTATGRSAAQSAVLQAQAAAMERDDDNAHFTAAAGSLACRAVQAFGAGACAPCVQLLRRIRSGAHRFGGSHAQRDVLDLTLLEAARRAGLQALAAGLHKERIALRPRTRTGVPLALAA
ncbi:MAG TPA: tetratricopeptide repeat protein [Ramlibacter sp.]|nr:tetratricopeptide repeat protein [Ramlibacter sp.]